MCMLLLINVTVFLPKRDYVTFRYMLSQIRLSSSSSVTFVHPTQPVKICRNVSTPFCTLAIRLFSSKKITEIVPGNPAVGELNARGVAKYSDVGHIEAISQKRPRVQLMANRKSYP